MAKNPSGKTVESFKHDEAKRLNIPTAEYQSVMDDEDLSPIRVAYERRNCDLDPQLVWRGKDVKDWTDLIVHAPPLYIQEKVHPKVLIDDLIRHSELCRPADLYQACSTTSTDCHTRGRRQSSTARRQLVRRMISRQPG